jgi:hypothetical protein
MPTPVQNINIIALIRNVTEPITQTAHGFTGGEVVRYDVTTPNLLVLAQADTEANAAAVGVVIQITNANEFVIAYSGKIISGVPAVAQGTVMYLSDTVAGGLTSTAPTIAVRIMDIGENALSAVVNIDFQGSGGSTTYATDTYANWEVKRLAGTLPKGKWIEVTAIPSQPSAIFSMFCTETNEIALGGFGQFLNADWQNVGVYTGVFALTGVAFTSNIGQWYAGIEGTAIDGDVVIWNCLHYQVTDAAAFAGTDPAATPLAYTLLPKATANMGYITEVDQIEFVFVDDWLQYRADKRGNRFLYTSWDDAGFGFTAINLFQWGRADWIYNISNGGWIDQINYIGQIAGNVLGKYGVIENNTGTGGIVENEIGSNCFIDSNINEGNIGNNTLIGNTGISNVILSPGQDFSGNTLFVGGGGYSLGNNTNSIASPGLNTFQESIGITGLTTLDLLSATVGIYNLTSGNATETINLISNFPALFPFTLKPETGLTVTVTFTAVGSLSANDQIVGPTANIVLNGDNGDELTLQAATVGGFSVTVQKDANTNI